VNILKVLKVNITKRKGQPENYLMVPTNPLWVFIAGKKFTGKTVRTLTFLLPNSKFRDFIGAIATKRLTEFIKR